MSNDPLDPDFDSTGSTPNTPANSNRLHFEHYRTVVDGETQHGVRLVAGNGEIICSGELYNRIEGVFRVVRLIESADSQTPLIWAKEERGFTGSG